ncbi:CpaF/VirB11 family protein [Phytomonospora sp. NPDC050363]|uniref:CpaF family protein n=1 Tax=Phytomonospora sp. NPDC050363 TaxID=3155642 RepID=UPI0034037CD5
MGPEATRALRQEVIANLAGLGRLEKLIADPTIEEVHIIGHDNVRITYTNGMLAAGDPVADSDEELEEMVQAVGRRLGGTERSFSDATPTLEMQLPDGSRLAAVRSVSHRPSVVIRRHNTMRVTLKQLAGGDPHEVPPEDGPSEMIDQVLRNFLTASLNAGLNIMIAGLAGAGKTTILRALGSQIPAHEPIAVLEESRELGFENDPAHPFVFSIEAREGHGELRHDGRPAGEITLADMVPRTLRWGVRRIIVGEVRSREIVPMLQAMAVSQGSLCTIHARSAEAVQDRIVELALSHGSAGMSPALARRMTGGALDLIVYVNVVPAYGTQPTERYVSHVYEVDRADDDRIHMTEVFGPDYTRRGDGRAVLKHFPQRNLEKLQRVGLSKQHFLVPYVTGPGTWRGGNPTPGQAA